MKRLNLFLALVLFSGMAMAQDENASESLSSKLNRFRASGMMLKQGDTNSGSLYLSWNPKLYRYKDSIFGVSIGGSVFENQDQHNFLFLEYMASWKYLITKRWKAELTVGFQTYEGEIGTHGAIGGNVLYAVKKNKFHIDDVFIGYSRNSYSDEILDQYRIGVAFHF